RDMMTIGKHLFATNDAFARNIKPNFHHPDRRTRGWRRGVAMRGDELARIPRRAARRSPMSGSSVLPSSCGWSRGAPRRACRNASRTALLSRADRLRVTGAHCRFRPAGVVGRLSRIRTMYRQGRAERMRRASCATLQRGGEPMRKS
ncbi:MAG: hypothetical protein ABWY78_16410, partial [Microvirga sp.]